MNEYIMTRYAAALVEGRMAEAESRASRASRARRTRVTRRTRTAAYGDRLEN